MGNPGPIIDAQSACFYVRNCDTEQQQQSPIRVSSRPASYRCQLRKAGNLQCQLTLVERLNLTGKILLLAALCGSLLILSLCPPVSVQAKVHHSKRQTQLQTPTNQPSSGRASTNWWNVWWQQYINEAEQPTVRPIVAVSFNGRSINLSRQEQDQQQQLDMTDDLSLSSDSYRNGYQQSSNLSPAMGSLNLNRKPLQQQLASNQMSWQLSRPMERNMISQSGTYDDVPMGIQMRGQVSRNRQMRPSATVVPAEEQQVYAVDGGQEEQIQQHYQMLDYSDENDPQLLAQDGKQTDDNDSEQEPSNDSSSSNMMSNQNRKSTTLSSRAESPSTTTSDNKQSVTLFNSTQPVITTTTTTVPSTISAKPLRQATVIASTQGTTFIEMREPQSTTPATPTPKPISSKIPATILETNKIIQTTTSTQSSTETNTKMRETEENSTTQIFKKPTTTQTPIETTIAPVASTLTNKSNETSNTIAINTSLDTTSSQKLTTTTTTETPSTTTPSEAGTATESATPSDDNKQTVSSVNSSTTAVTLDSDAVINESGVGPEEDDGDDGDDPDEDSTIPDAGPNSSTTTVTQSPDNTGPSTQLPVIDLARLPKTTTTQSTQQQTSTETPTSLTTGSKLPTPRLMNSNVDLDLMKAVVEEDSAITLPMETFMRMMNQVAAMNEAATAAVSPTPGGIQMMSTTLTTTPSTVTTEEDQESDTTTPNSPLAFTTPLTSTQQITTTDPKSVVSSDITTVTTPRRRLQPPPTTTELSTTTDQTTTTTAPTSIPNQSSAGKVVIVEDKSTTTMMDDTSSTIGTQKTVMLNIAPNEEGSKADTKIELMDLDLMPIQRVMALNNQQQTSTSVAPMSISTTTDKEQPKFKQETMSMDVEPGMRLRPPTTLPSMTISNTTKKTQPIYMIMLNQQLADELNNSSTIGAKFSTITGLLTMNPLRSTTPAPQTTPSKPTTTIRASVITTTTTPEPTTTVVSSTRNQATEIKISVITETTPVPTSTTNSSATRATTNAPVSLSNVTLNATTTTAPLNLAEKSQVPNKGKTINRIFGKQPNGTSSFVSTRLRANLGTKQLSSTKINQASTRLQSNNPSQMVQGIRQFGGANRMSVLENQPVAFGRPTMMTSNSQQRYQAPVFEYGASIVVKRPDEPLANGQMPNCTLTGKNFCVLTKDYPMNEVRQAVERSFRSVRIMYEELQTVSDQELHKEDFNTTNNQAASGKFACQTQVEMMRPGWAKDELTKEWMLVVNTDVFPQRVRTESCAQPNTPCEFIAPFYDSTCQQRYSLHRMIAIDPHDASRSPQVAVFKFPAGCVCRVHPIRKTLS